MAKKQKKPSKPVKAHTFFDNGKLKKRTCPKCGPGVHLAEHNNRVYCGKCHYSEFKR